MQNPRRDFTLLGRSLTLIALSASLAAACQLNAPPRLSPRDPNAAALDIMVLNGSARPMTMMLGETYYVDSLTVQERVTDYPDSDIIDWLASQTGFASLEWGDVQAVTVDLEEEVESRGISGAPWMGQKHAFTLTFVDESDAVVAGPITFTNDDYILVRPVVYQWAEPVHQVGEYGHQAGDYSALELISDGSFDGAEDDIYVIEVEVGGTTADPLDGPDDETAMVTLRSVRGDDAADPVPVLNGLPIALGSHGAQLTFAASPSTVHLIQGDRWLVRCTSERGENEPAVVGPATPGPTALFNALAEVRFMFQRESLGAFSLPVTTRGLRIKWGRQDQPYFIPIQPYEPAPDAPPEAPPAPGYGLEIDMDLSAPANGRNYKAGETIEMTVNLTDREGAPLHEPDGFPPYMHFVQNRSNGIQYYDFRIPFSCHPIFAECGLTFFRTGLWGPLHRVKQNYTEEHPHDWYAVEYNIPQMGVIFGGFGNPDLWQRPLSNKFEFEIPEDAYPGTYMAVVKVSRKYMGETLHRWEQRRIQVKSDEETDFIQDVGNCRVCHVRDARLERLRHGIADWRTCKFCHVPPHAGTAGTVVHQLHFYSTLYPDQRNDCTWCHLTKKSNQRASRLVCGACHGDVHEEEFGGEATNPLEQCGETCHAAPPAGHVPFPPQ